MDEKRSNSEHSRTGPDENGRQPYVAPEVKSLGNFRDLVATGGATLDIDAITNRRA